VPDVYSTPSLRVGIFRCPPEDALWHETNDNIGERPHVVFPGTAVGLVRHGVRLTATPNDVVFYRPFETYERTLRDARGDVSSSSRPATSTCRPPRSAGPTRAASCSPGGSHAARRRAVRRGDPAELITRAVHGPAAPSGRRPATRRQHTELVEAAKDCCSNGSSSRSR
jgi:hypothetical protein